MAPRGLICETIRHESNRKKHIHPAPLYHRRPRRCHRLDAGNADLDAQGCAVLKGLLSPDECHALAALYPDDTNFRSRVVMGRHGFGRGEYKYFAYPLPDLIAELRPALYRAALRHRESLERGDGHRYPLSRSARGIPEAMP